MSPKRAPDEPEGNWAIERLARELDVDGIDPENFVDPERVRADRIARGLCSECGRTRKPGEATMCAQCAAEA